MQGYGTTSETQFYSFTDKNLKPGSYSYRLKQIDFDDSFEYSQTIEVEITSPNEFVLYQNYPNPFNPTTKIKFSIPSVIASETKQSQLVTLKVYDMLGREVTTLINKEMEAGTYEVEFNASKLSSGIYFYRLTAGSYSEILRMLLLK